MVVKENTPEFVRNTFLPVLNNLAQCTLQLGMHQKTILFCETALEETNKIKLASNGGSDGNENGNGDPGGDKQRNKKQVSDGDDDKVTSTSAFTLAQQQKRDLEDAVALCKILFKQAKALRLTGHYGKAREALKRSLDCLAVKEIDKDLSAYCSSSAVASGAGADADDNGNGNTDIIDIPSFLTPYKKAIHKEYRCLDIAEKEARKNRARQKRAMQTVLSSTTTTTTTTTTTSNSDLSIAQGKSSSSKRNNQSAGYLPSPQQQQPLYGESPEPRQFSRLRSRKFKPPDPNAQQSVANDNSTSVTAYYYVYSQYYWSMVARVAKALLIMLVDDEEEAIDGNGNRNSNGEEISNHSAQNTNFGKKHI
uniref:Uncharacterized protein n=1 Tax=Pseudo-nitzschia australis TaxID=44445 RepID=A0A6V0B9P8_9STRA